MKITILASGSIRSNFSYRVLALGQGLSKLGHHVSIIAPSADKYNEFVPEKIESIGPVKIWQPFQFATKRLEINLLPYMFGAARRVLAEKPDLIYIYKPTPVSAVGLIGKLFYGTPVVMDMDDLGSEVMKVEGHPIYQRKLVEWSERLVARFADKIVAASTHIKNIYQAQYPDKSIHVMSNAVDPEWFDAATPTKEKRRIVFMGALNRKGILEPLFDVMPDVLKRHPDTKALIMGDGAFLQYFKDKCAALGVSGSVEFTGWLKLDQARERLHAGDIGYNYMPDTATTRAVNNMKVPQYMARGLAPIVSDIGDLAAIVELGKAGYVCKADDLEGFKAMLITALGDEHRMEKGERARVVAKHTFDWDALALELSQWLWPRAAGKIYFVATNVPGNVGGGEIRNFNLVKQIVRHSGAPVEVFCISDKHSNTELGAFQAETGAACRIVPSRTQSVFAALKAVLIHRVPPFMDKFRSSGLGDMFRAACEESLPAIVHIEQPTGYYCIREHIQWLRSKGVKIVFDCHNVEYRAFAESLQILSLPKRIAGWLLVRNLKEMELEAAERADAVLACSTGDADFFRAYNQNTHVVPNGVDCAEFAPSPKKELGHVLIFMGGVGYPPNADGLRFYLQSVHPLVKKLVPDVRLLAIGAKKEWLDAQGLSDPSVEPLGFVDDVRPHLARASAGICPIRFGSGTRIKIMTYMATGLPVVSTAKGAEGVGYTDGSDIILADEPQAFADGAHKLLTDAAYHDRMGKAGREFILANFDWDAIGKKLAPIYRI